MKARNLHSVDGDYFTVQKRLLSYHERYDIGDENGEPIIYVERKRETLKKLFAIIMGILSGTFTIYLVSEFIGVSNPFLAFFLSVVAFMASVIYFSPVERYEFFPDETKEFKVLEMIQGKGLFPKFILKDAEGRNIARLSKNNFSNLFFPKRYYCHSISGTQICVAKGRFSFRSILQFLPLISRPTARLTIFRGVEETVLGEFQEALSAVLTTPYILDMNADRLKFMDRRIAVAMSVFLVSGEYAT